MFPSPADDSAAMSDVSAAVEATLEAPKHIGNTCSSVIGQNGKACAKCDFSGGSLPCSKLQQVDASDDNGQYQHTSDCPEDLSSGGFWRVQGWNKREFGMCQRLLDQTIVNCGILTFQTGNVSWFLPELNVTRLVTKLFVTKADMGSLHTGIVGFKRIVVHQVDGKEFIDTYKVGRCVKCPLLDVSLFRAPGESGNDDDITQEHFLNDKKVQEEAIKSKVLSEDKTKRSVFHHVRAQFVTRTERQVFLQECFAKAFHSNGTQKNDYMCADKKSGVETFNCPHPKHKVGVDTNRYSGHRGCFMPWRDDWGVYEMEMMAL
jgi:hypothetical protein